MIFTTEKVTEIYNAVKALYLGVDDLPFHGWHHIEFVYRKVSIYADDLGVDRHLAQVCALVHDLNYLAHKKKWTSAVDGRELRHAVLKGAGVDEQTIEVIETIITEEATENRNDRISDAAKALSDADTLFKALPITPILFASRFITQTGYDIRKLAGKIVAEQKPLMTQDIYFYSNTARTEYMGWARINLALWDNVAACLDDPDVVDMLKMAGFSCGTK